MIQDMEYKLTAQELINMHRVYKNYQEKRVLGTRTQMWDYHWMAGDKNYTIWAILYKEYTGNNYQGQAWCAMYGTCVVALAFAKKYPDLSSAEVVKLTKAFFGNAMPYNCQLFVNTHKSDSKMDHTPKVGDSVIFWTGAKYGHWGTVSGVDANGKGFTSIEGNTSGGADKIDPDGGAVVEKWHSLSGKEYFYHHDFAVEETTPDNPIYKIKTGKAGLRITASTLNVRNGAGSSYKKVTTLKQNDYVFPTEKTFVGHTAWYHIDKGWISAMYVEGWVYEEDAKRWWWVKPGYTFSTNAWEKIDGCWYWFDNTGYIAENEWIEYNGASYFLKEGGAMATNTWIKSICSEKWYWVNNSGAWYSNKSNYTTTKEPDTYILGN